MAARNAGIGNGRVSVTSSTMWGGFPGGGRQRASGQDQFGRRVRFSHADAGRASESERAALEAWRISTRPRANRRLPPRTRTPDGCRRRSAWGLISNDGIARGDRRIGWKDRLESRGCSMMARLWALPPPASTR